MPRYHPADTIWIIFYAPIIEELFFRLPLRNFFKHIFISLAIAFYAIIKNFTGIVPAIALAILIAALPYIPDFINRKENRINEWIGKYYPFYFYFVVLFFGFLHIFNLEHLTLKICFIIF